MLNQRHTCYFVTVLGQLAVSGDMFSRHDHRAEVNRILQPDTIIILVVIFCVSHSQSAIRGYFPRLR